MRRMNRADRVMRRRRRRHGERAEERKRNLVAQAEAAVDEADVVEDQQRRQADDDRLRQSGGGEEEDRGHVVGTAPALRPALVEDERGEEQRAGEQGLALDGERDGFHLQRVNGEEQRRHRGGEQRRRDPPREPEHERCRSGREE